MDVRLIRHATLLVRLGTSTLLVDPMLSPTGAMNPFLPAPNDQPNPLVPLPDLDHSSVDAALVTHTHIDHFDEEARNVLREDLPIFCQPQDEQKMLDSGFSAINPVEEDLRWNDIEIFRTGGQHGPGNANGLGGNMGPVSGFVLRAQNEPSLYIAGDTVWCPEVEEALESHRPEIVVVNAGAAQLTAGYPITMTEGDVAEVCRRVPSATVIAVHMEAINHCHLTRKVLEDFVERVGLSEQVHIPADGEKMEF